MDLKHTDDFGLPTEKAAAVASVAKALLDVSRNRTGDSQEIVLTSSDGTSQAVQVPQVAMDLLGEILGEIAQGNGVQLAPINKYLTTQEVAVFLGVSRPHVVSLLEANQIPYTKLKSHRRVRYADVLEYLQKQENGARLSSRLLQKVPSTPSLPHEQLQQLENEARFSND